MRIGLVHVTTRRSGRKARREEEIEASRLAVGRGTDNDLKLGDLAVSLRHAAFHEGADGVYVEAVGAAEVRVNGRRIGGETRVRPGDAIRIGPYELRVVEPEAGRALQLEIEMSERRGSEREELLQRTRIGVESGWFTRRKLSWALVLLVVGGFLALPLASGRQGSWNSGSISRKHSFIAEDCGACHTQGFEAVRDDGCLACHARIERHTAPEVRVGELESARCATCHVEHNGASGLAALDQAYCAGCHGDIAAVHEGTDLGNASDFSGEHPEFRLRLVTEPGSGAPALAEWSPGLEERSGVRFNHLRHVGQALDLPDGETGSLDCGHCHRLDAGDQYFEPVSFERDCQACHALGFGDPDLGDRQALHGDPVRMRENLRGLYYARAIEGKDAADAGAPQLVRFLRPGQTLSDEDRAVVSEWVAKRVAQAESRLFEQGGECARCHELLEGSASDGGMGVAAVEVARVWMPRSGFRHGTHAPFACRECHPRAAVYDPEDAPELPRPAWSLEGAGPYALFTPAELPSGSAPSERASDVLVPGLDTCRTCHGGAYDSPPRVASECVLCHPFHREENGPIRSPESLAAGRAPTADR